MTTDAGGIVIRHFDASARHLRDGEEVDLFPALACASPGAPKNFSRMSERSGASLIERRSQNDQVLP